MCDLLDAVSSVGGDGLGADMAAVLDEVGVEGEADGW